MAVKTKSERGPAGTLTVDDLTRAIKNSIDRTGMKEEEARAMAQHVLNFFGYSERIIDNVLEPEDRDAFYMLEDSGILTTEREETTLYDGREGLRPDLVREDRVVQIPADGERQGQSESVRLVPRQDGGEPGQGLRVERMEAPFPGAACRFRLSEEPGEALLLDDEARVHAAQFEGDPTVERARAVHGCLSTRVD